jgi:hypothetical protein
MFSKFRQLSLLAIISLSLVGCAPLATTDAGAEPEVPPEGQVYGSVGELREAYEAAGGDCSSWSQTNQVTVAAESGTCGTDTVLSTYTNSADRDSIVEFQRAFSDFADTNLLVGANWIVNSPNAAQVRETLRGTLVTK